MHALAAIAIGLLAGAWAAVLGWRFELAWVACLGVLGVASIVAVSTRAAAVRPAARIAPLLALLSALVGQAVTPAPSAPRSIPSGVLRLEGTLTRVRNGRFVRSVLAVERGAALEDGRAVLPGARIELSGLDAPVGTRLRALARARSAVRFENPTPHPDWPTHGALDGLGRLRGPPVVLEQAPAWRRAAHAVRAALRRRLDETLSPRAAGLARALLLGEARALSTEDRERVRDAGLSHVLAVSGLHVTLLAGAVVALLRRGLVLVPRIGRRIDPRRLACGLGVPFALAYALLVGDAPSAWRAAVTASLAWGLAAAGRRPSGVSVTASAAILLAALEPGQIGRPGFVLSIAATAAIVSGWEAERSWLRAGLAVGARTMLATCPAIVWLFGSVPLVGLLANLIAVPIAAALLLPLVALHALLALALPPLAPLSAGAVDVLGAAFLAACEVFSTVELGRDLPPPDVAEGLVITLACVALLALRRRRDRLLVLAVAAFALAGAELRLQHVEQPRDVLRATFLDVGQGDGALVDLPDGRLMVVDAGGAAGGGPDPGARVLVPLLRARRRSRIDVLVLSHPHPDHYGGLPALLERFEVGAIWDTGQADVETPEGALPAWLRAARARGVDVVGPARLCRGPRAFGAAVVTVLWPCPGFDAGWGPNDNSLVLEVAMGRRRLLLTGDAEAHAERTLLSAGALRPADVLKVAHHGSRTSSSVAFLDRVRPRVAVASAGRENRFGHPHPEVWSRLAERVPCAFRTDRDGGVVVWTDGDALVSRSASGRACRPRGARAHADEPERGPGRQALRRGRSGRGS